MTSAQRPQPEQLGIKKRDPETKAETVEPTGIWRMEDPQNSLVSHYMLPCDTLDEDRRDVCRTPQEAFDSSHWIAGMMSTKLASEIRIFSTRQSSGRKMDTITVVYASEEAKKRRAVLESTITRLSKFFEKNGKLTDSGFSLLNKRGSYNDEEISKRIQAYVAAGDSGPVSVVKVLVDVFNVEVAQGHTGKFTFESFDEAEGIVRVKGQGACATAGSLPNAEKPSPCGNLPFSQRDLEKQMQKRTGGLVRRLVIST